MNYMLSSWRIVRKATKCTSQKSKYNSSSRWGHKSVHNVHTNWTKERGTVGVRALPFLSSWWTWQDGPQANFTNFTLSWNEKKSHMHNTHIHFKFMTHWYMHSTSTVQHINYIHNIFLVRERENMLWAYHFEYELNDCQRGQHNVKPITHHWPYQVEIDGYNLTRKHNINISEDSNPSREPGVTGSQFLHPKLYAIYPNIKLPYTKSVHTRKFFQN